MSERNDRDTFRAILEEEVGGSFPALIDFDEQRGALYDQLTNTAVELNQTTDEYGPIGLDNDNLERPAHKLFTELLAGSADFDDKFRLVVDLIKADSDERITMMRGLVEENDEWTEFYTHDELIEVINTFIRIANGKESIETTLADFYQQDLAHDVANFLNHLVGMHKQKMAEISVTTRVKKGLGEHAVDVAKIAAGASIALALNHFLRKK